MANMNIILMMMMMMIFIFILITIIFYYYYYCNYCCCRRRGRCRLCGEVRGKAIAKTNVAAVVLATPEEIEGGAMDLQGKGR